MSNKIKYQELLISEQNPFQDCKLKREQYADVLTDIISTYNNGFVLAVNNEWGTGKTFFIKRWQQKLKTKGYTTIYFNAWENDFDINPLTALLAELQGITKTDNPTFKSLLKKATVLGKYIIPTVVKSVAKKYTGEDFSKFIESIAKGTTDILEDEIKEYTNKKKSILEFKHVLEKFVKEMCQEKPLVFIVDEMDRCRPDYAVELLEKIKHFFSVPNIVFILSIDKKHLGASIRGFYGSENIDANEYLRRFIDLEYCIPEPSNEDFIEYMIEYYDFTILFTTVQGKNGNYYAQFKETALKLFNKSGTTLRQQEKIFAHLRIALNSFGTNYLVEPQLLFFLIFIKIMHNDFYKKIENNKFSLQELADECEKIIPDIKSLYKYTNPLNIQGYLIYFYNNTQIPEKQVRLVAEDSFTQNMKITNIKSNLEIDSVWTLSHSFKQLKRMDIWNLKLTYFLNKINLTEPFVVK